MNTCTARALPSVGLPSMMSVWAFSAGTPGTSSSTAASIAVPTMALPSRRAANPAAAAATKATMAATTKPLVPHRSR